MNIDKKLLTKINKFAAKKNSLRTQLTFICCEDNRLVATNGNTLVATDTDLADGFYNQSGEKIDTDITYPNYKQLLYASCLTGRIDISQLDKCIPTKTPGSNPNSWGMIGLRFGSYDVIRYVNMGYLRHVLDFFTGKIFVHYTEDATARLMFSDEQDLDLSETYCLVMPTRWENGPVITLDFEDRA